MSIDNSGWTVRCKSCRNTFMYHGENSGSCPYCAYDYKSQPLKPLNFTGSGLINIERDEDTIIVRCFKPPEILSKDVYDSNGHIIEGRKVYDYVYYNFIFGSVVVPLRLLSVVTILGKLPFTLIFTGSEENMQTLIAYSGKLMSKKFTLPKD